MFSPTHVNSALHEQMSRVFSAVHRAAFEEARGDGPDPLLAVPVRLIPLVQTTRSLRDALQKESATRQALEALLDLAMEPLLAIDAQRRILFANAAARRLLQSGEPFCRDATRLQLADWQADQRLECALRTGVLENDEQRPTGIARLAVFGRPAGRTIVLLQLRSVPDGADREPT